MKRRLIEYNLPLTEISDESAREKNIRHGHPSTLHIWWARRPLASTRATTLAALLEDPGPEEPEKREDLQKLIRDITPWDAVKDGNVASVRKARELVRDEFEGQAPRVLDPFCGGGTIPLEARRLGCDVTGSDYNPIATLVSKATFEWPQRFNVKVDPGELSPLSEASDGGWFGEEGYLVELLVDKWGKAIRERAEERLEDFYPKATSDNLVGKRETTEISGWTPVGYIWARTVPCGNPTCGTIIPLVNQYWLCKKTDKEIAYRVAGTGEDGHVRLELLSGKELAGAREEGFDPTSGTVTRGKAECPSCGQVVSNEDLRALANDGEMGERLLAIVYHHPDETGKKYRLATEEDRDVFGEAHEALTELVDNWSHMDTPLPTEALNPKRPSPNARGLSGLTRYHFETFEDLFNTRQKLSMAVFLDEIKKAFPPILNDAREIANDLEIAEEPEEIAQAVHGYLGLVFGRLADKNANVVPWNSYRETIEHVYGRQAIPMVWDYVELNVLSGVNGDWSSNLEWVQRFLRKNRWTTESVAEAQQQSATDLNHSDEAFDAVITDPPYYDNVPYADLSDFFYVWLKRAIGNTFPDLFSTALVPKEKEAVMQTSRHSSLDEAEAFFEDMLTKSFEEINRVLKPGGVAVFVYAHKTTAGWETMLNSLVESGFTVTGSWPIHTERKDRLVAARAAALASSIYMVCRKVEREPVGYWNEVKPRVRSRVEEKLNQFWPDVAGGDFFISAIGPGMEEFSKFERIEKVSGEEVSTGELLQFIRDISADFLVHRLLKDATPESIDKESMFYLTYRWTYMDNKVPFDDAKKLATAEGVNLEELWGEDGFVKKTRENIYVHGPKERAPVKDVDNMVDAMHRAALLWESGRSQELETFLEETEYVDESAFWQLCQAIAECFPNGNKEKQLLEGLLMTRQRSREGVGARSTLEDFGTKDGGADSSSSNEEG